MADTQNYISVFWHKNILTYTDRIHFLILKLIHQRGRQALFTGKGNRLYFIDEFLRLHFYMFHYQTLGPG